MVEQAETNPYQTVSILVRIPAGLVLVCLQTMNRVASPLRIKFAVSGAPGPGLSCTWMPKRWLWLRGGGGGQLLLTQSYLAFES